ncbi:Putative sterigmatocystin biosynthesis peroxidase stcC [Fulvia fulva]|uniref:Sterigmatocystin biosynthesis peroxidase stcC n=1 Tax=Passalora fulva TaxID=5499 RepID=A0A9Q8UQM2_PASFU|nr:Putative sterigmatocystin biosynthesis peroxidase stcC [Fulvia fulva]UJO18822.1 Putative sterigmatocystin biosynthesis peroxidase stcC [Fulvia fulva]
MTSLLLFVCALGFSFAQSAQAPVGHEYTAPGPNDVRSPCPGINSAADHGYIPRSGKNLSPIVVAQGLLEGLNVGLDFGLPVALAATLSNPNPLAGTFDMDDLREHNFPIEHDVSLSRQDFYQGDNLHFNQSVFNEVLSFYSNTNRTTISLAADALWSRIRTKRSLNGDEEIYSGRQLVLGLVETSLYMSLMGDPLTGDAPIDYVKSFFEQERLPYELGWTAPAVQINFVTLGAMAAQVLLSKPQDLLIDLPNLNAGTLRDVFQLKDPLTGTVINATCALAGLC